MTENRSASLMKIERLLAKRTKKSGSQWKIGAHLNHVIVEQLKDKEQVQRVLRQLHSHAELLFESILLSDYRRQYASKGEVQYLAKWRGCSWRNSIWLNEGDIYDARLIEQYEKRTAMHEARLGRIKSGNDPIEQAGQASNEENGPPQLTGSGDDLINMDGSSSSLEELGSSPSASECDETDMLDNSQFPGTTGLLQRSPTPLSIRNGNNRALSANCEEDDPISVGFEYPFPEGYLHNDMERVYECPPEKSLSDLELAGIKVNPTRCYFTSLANTKLSSFRKLLVLKYHLPPTSKIEIACGGQIIPEHYSLRDVVNLFLEGQKSYVHFYFRVVRGHAEDADEQCLRDDVSLD